VRESRLLDVFESILVRNESLALLELTYYVYLSVGAASKYNQ